MSGLTYTPLHVHSIYSQLDGFSRVEQIVDRAIEIKAHGVCITDHAYATSHYELGELCEKKGIKPIFAVEGYLSPRDNTIHEKIEGFKDYYHITLVAKNKVGYSNLMKLIADSFLNGKYRKARFSMNTLERWSEGIICLTACLGGVVSQMLANDRDEEAEQWMSNLKEIYGENLFAELTYTGLEEQDKVNVKMIELANKLDVQVVCTPDSHYTNKTDTDFHRAMVCINVNQSFVPSGKEKDGEDVDESGMFYQPGQYWIKDRETLTAEYYHKFEDHNTFFENTNKIADSIDWIKFDKEKKFPCDHDDPDKELMKRIIIGLNSKIESGILKKEDREIYISRLKEELDTIMKMGFSDYFIEIQNIVKWSNDNGITTGPGRGCFYESTLVLSKERTLEIKNVKPGMEVYTSEHTYQKVIAILTYDIEEPLTCITYKNFDNIFHRVFCTKDHKHLVVSKNSNPVKEMSSYNNQISPVEMIPFYLEASLINPLDHALVSSNFDRHGGEFEKVYISDVYETTPMKTKVYDLMVEGNNTYMVHNHFVHNSGAGSFINYLLDITRVNPLTYGLLFSRKYCAV